MVELIGQGFGEILRFRLELLSPQAVKSNRVMETFRQVICFRAALENPGLQDGWKRFAEVMTGKVFQWHPSQETRGVVIWPTVGKNSMHALANEKRKGFARVEVVGYRENNHYTLEPETLAEES